MRVCYSQTFLFMYQYANPIHEQSSKLQITAYIEWYLTRHVFYFVQHNMNSLCLCVCIFQLSSTKVLMKMKSTAISSVLLYTTESSTSRTSPIMPHSRGRSRRRTSPQSWGAQSLRRVTPWPRTSSSAPRQWWYPPRPRPTSLSVPA